MTTASERAQKKEQNAGCLERFDHPLERRQHDETTLESNEVRNMAAAGSLEAKRERGARRLREEEAQSWGSAEQRS